jgi:hypothetical protein
MEKVGKLLARGATGVAQGNPVGRGRDEVAQDWPRIRGR